MRKDCRKENGQIETKVSEENDQSVAKVRYYLTGGPEEGFTDKVEISRTTTSRCVRRSKKRGNALGPSNVSIRVGASECQIR